MDDYTKIKKELRRLLAADKLKEVLQQLLDFTETVAAKDLHEEAVLQSGRFEQYRKDLRTGGVDYQVLARTKTAINQSVLEIISLLPEVREDGTVAYISPKGIREQVLRSHILWMMFGIKFLIILFVLTLWQSGRIHNGTVCGYPGFVAADLCNLHHGNVQKQYPGAACATICHLSSGATGEP